MWREGKQKVKLDSPLGKIADNRLCPILPSSPLCLILHVSAHLFMLAHVSALVLHEAFDADLSIDFFQETLKKEQKTSAHIIHLWSQDQWFILFWYRGGNKVNGRRLKNPLCGLRFKPRLWPLVHFQNKNSNWVTHPFSIYEPVA